MENKDIVEDRPDDHGYRLSDEEKKELEAEARRGIEMVEVLVDFLEGRDIPKSKFRKLYRNW